MSLLLHLGLSGNNNDVMQIDCVFRNLRNEAEECCGLQNKNFHLCEVLLCVSDFFTSCYIGLSCRICNVSELLPRSSF
jgi:hypothetical protein